ncbi:uncharacterized protein K444DRAFT_616008 [Hyaloscypha bicolor E]|uniref:Uncharacterized protein n=1 Tax=Hyaloscypha bicolor E TaxID=1095630 RepID=A0A2J6SZW2_9HELO|nr:uncharacterized protein K444DRAFT_616008 [Hyaloscypha bicolor E]PMD56213.1 hypothetical protein K444DRAFT_616008 [Hyaloscypha bicolor E]
MAVEETAKLLTEEAHRFMMASHVDMDAIITEVRGRVRLQQSEAVLAPLNPSPPLSTSRHPHGSSAPNSSQVTLESLESPSAPTSPGTQPSGHRRIPSEAESLAESLKENEGESEPPTGVRRPDGPRGFSNDITKFIDDERERSEGIATNRRS